MLSWERAVLRGSTDRADFVQKLLAHCERCASASVMGAEREARPSGAHAGSGSKRQPLADSVQLHDGKRVEAQRGRARGGARGRC